MIGYTSIIRQTTNSLKKTLWKFHPTLFLLLRLRQKKPILSSLPTKKNNPLQKNEKMKMFRTLPKILPFTCSQFKKP